MMRHSLNVVELDSLQVLSEDSERVFCRGRRLGQDGNRIAVLVVRPVAEHPSPSILDRLTNEYELRDELDGIWAAKPLELMRDGGRAMLVLEDTGGEPLHRALGAPMEAGRFLGLAIGIATALGKLHQRGLIHKDIKPANILVNEATGEVRLTGFGIASRLARERRAIESPESLTGTLAYMAPEQTGRMNRSIDSCSDLYALGVTFYQMLTGILPFTATDPMELVHCHLARRPVPPADRVKVIPGPVSAIIMKLLAKTSEDRYQTAAGLESDLRRCLTEWQAQRRIDDFPLGEHDTPDRLLIPEKLYGRGREVETLLASFNRIVNGGAPELVLVSGYSGIGKSSVVNELHKALVAPRGLFASGKFDQHKRDIPYATVAQAFQKLVQSLLGKSEVELARWRDALRAALEPNGRLMVDLVPKLALIIGEQPPVAELSPKDAQHRFQLVLRRFIGVFARREHPLALFLDDLQWLDAATLDLLEDVLTRSELQHLMLIGAYRDNEVTPAHPLMRKLNAIRNAGTPVQELKLGPLSGDHVGQLLADAVRCEPALAAPLAELVHEKTGGNPFFVIQFLSALADEGLLAFDPDAACWWWDVGRIHAKGYTDNVADLMVGKLSRLPATTREVLQQLACLGNSADLTTLALVRGTSEEQVGADLWEAVRLELIERLNGAYGFVHDRVQEAAYSLIPERSRADAHLRIGRLLAAHTPKEKREDAIFEIVNQLNRGAACIASQDEREQLADLNLIAGKRAKASSAYASALTYLAAGSALLADTGWERCYRLTFDLGLNRAECEYLTGELASAEARLTTLSIRARSTIDSAAVTCVRINLYTTLDQSDSAVRVGLEYLRGVEDEWSPHPTAEDVRRDYERLSQQLRSSSIEALIDLPPMRDPDRCATMDVLTVLTSPALFTDSNLFRLVVSRMALLSLEYGNGDGSCLAYEWLGGVLGTYFGDYHAGLRFGRLGLDLVDKHGLNRFRARVYLVFAVHVAHWTQPLQTSLDLLRRAFAAALDSGDLSYAAYSCIDVITHRIAAGDPLAEIKREAEQGLEFAQKLRFGLANDCITGQLWFIRMLCSPTLDLTSFNDAEFDDACFEQRLENPQLAIPASYYWIRKLQASVYAGDKASAIAALSKAAPLLWTVPTQVEQSEYQFYGALARAARCDEAPAEERCQHLAALADHHRQIAVWAKNCPATFANRAALVAAEIARLEGRELDAERLYEEAIRSAHEHNFVQNEGLANELAARFYETRGFKTISQAYLQKARYCYLRWGANGKVRQLDELYPQLRENEPIPGPTSTIVAPAELLDLATVIKVSQAVSGEMVLERVTDRLMRTAIEHAGAERGLLICPRGEELEIDALATSRGEDVAVRVRERDARIADALPESLIRYAIRTRETVILDDASSQNPFSADPYIAQRQARSVLCLPLVNQGKLVGVLYLENNLIPNVFSPNRVTVLKVLASQAAISLDNTRLYRDIAEREAKIRRLVDSNVIGIFIWELEGRIIEANDAFLRMVGYDREDLASGRVHRRTLSPPEWRDRDERSITELKMLGTVFPIEKEYFRKDGGRVPVLIGLARFEESGNQGVAFVLDLTERKRAEEALRDREEALRRSEAWLTQAQRLSHTGNWVYDATTMRYRYWSEESYRIWGFDPLRGLPSRENMWGRIHPDDRDKAWEEVQEALRQKRDFTAEFRILLPDGTVKYLEATTRHVFSSLGALVEAVSSHADVTERKHAQDEHERLRQLESDLAHMNRLSMMGELTASLAHEITQPIASARNNARAAQNFLDRHPPDLAEIREALGCVVGDADRAGNIIDRIRDQLNKAPPRKQHFDLNESINEVLVLARSAITKNGVSVQTRLAEGLLPVHGDRVQLQQVVLNLVLNAVEAMSLVESATRQLSISTEQHLASGVLVTVCDSGPGIDPEYRERVFQAFYTTKNSGVGMGLAICRSIIDAHGGRLWMEAKYPRGATFRFTLPGAGANA